MTDPTYDIPISTVEIPVPCGPTTVASLTVSHPVRDNGFVDTEVAVMRSCGHGPYYWCGPGDHEPVTGSRAMTCLGPQVETMPSGRADPSLPPMKKGKRWQKLKGAV